jgi:hypothetical protein
MTTARIVSATLSDCGGAERVGVVPVELEASHESVAKAIDRGAVERAAEAT